MIGTDWSAVREWLGLGGLLFVALTYWSSRRDLRRVHASRVYVAPLISSGSALDFNSIRVRNDGELPIFDVTISLHEYGRRRKGWRVGGRTRKRSHWWTGAAVVGGSRSYTCILPRSEAEDADELPGVNPPAHRTSLSPPVIATFRDGTGRAWVRWPNGQLSSLGRRALP